MKKYVQCVNFQYIDWGQIVSYISTLLIHSVVHYITETTFSYS